MRILGIDPGFAIVGWSIIDTGMKLVDFGAIETSPSLPLDDRLFLIHNSLKEIISRYKPEEAAIERLFFSRNTTTGMDVARASGVIILTLKMAGLEFREYTPSQVKLALTGSGRATKEQMQVMVMRIFGIRELPKPDDAADAIAIAACHSFTLR